MSRVTYNEDYQWGWIQWAGAAKKAIYGRPGQTFLKELKEALLALPEKKLIADEFMTAQGEVCALGAVAKARGIDMTGIDIDDSVADIAKAKLGCTFTLAWEIMAQNDDGGSPYFWDADKWTPEQRYEHVLHWVERHIQ